jgi:hypothetical protein
MKKPSQLSFTYELHSEFTYVGETLALRATTTFGYINDELVIDIEVCMLRVTAWAG